MDDLSRASQKEMVAVGRFREQRVQLRLLQATSACRVLEQAVSARIRAIEELEHGQRHASHAYAQHVLAGRWASPLEAFIAKGLEHARRQEVLLGEDRRLWQESVLQVRQIALRLAVQQERVTVYQELLAQSEQAEYEQDDERGA